MYSDRILANFKHGEMRDNRSTVKTYNLLAEQFLSEPRPHPEIRDHRLIANNALNESFLRGHQKYPDIRDNTTTAKNVLDNGGLFHRGQNYPDIRGNSIVGGTLAETMMESDEPDISAAEVSLMQKALRSQLVHSSHEVEVWRQDSRSPLSSAKTFRELNLSDDLLKGVYAMGFNAPSKIQETTLPTLIADPPVNMIAQSQSGTGKTAAFVLSCLSRVKAEIQYPQVLILSPTNELAFQTGQVAMQMGKFCTGIEFRYVVKGEELRKGHRLTEQVLIGTPGKVYDWSRKRRFFDLHRISCFVLDEADIMISLQGHLDQCLQIHRYMSQECQTMLFSATYTPDIMEFAEMIITEPIIIRLRREEETLVNVKQYYIECSSPAQKYVSIRNIYGVLSIGQVIIFCRTKKTAAWLGKQMTEDGHSVAYLSSELDIRTRLTVLSSFRDGREKVLITTDVCARGIDVEQVTVVINFDLPVTLSRRADCETYLHRIGRSGRFGKRGVAFNMVADQKDLEVIKAIEEHFGRKISKVDGGDLDQLEGIDVK